MNLDHLNLVANSIRKAGINFDRGYLELGIISLTG